ncbi:hypothetical protein LSH36_264g01016 [Paralvinella palmiformis]|uniref:glycerophosphodiester phosphodiesterase n=1 Tax=Paralvinella palmiformis TaxID=53620 RepID=A0AAD9JKU9_9ANNE|nr:hypothetical protein LSH36_264g01016 [Paralvinella palmiformis]
MTPISFERAVHEGADMVECDVCVTRDLQLVCSHESWMEENTNVADIFPSSRRNTYYVDDQSEVITDYFTVDFTLGELNTIGKRQRYDFRDPTHNYAHPMATVEQVIELARDANRTVRLLAEIKDPIWVNSLDFMQNNSATVESLLLDLLQRYGYDQDDSPAAIQAFNEDVIRGLRPLTPIHLSVLIRDAVDVTDEKFAEFAQYADSVAVTKSLIVVTNSDNQIINRTDVIQRAHAAGLGINVWTFRNENRYLAWDYGQDIYNEMEDFLGLGVDGFITDFTDTAVRFLNNIYNCTG